jgi:hypothetical protein
MSGVIMMKKTNKNSKKFYQEQMQNQAKQLAKTRDNKYDYKAVPKIIDKKVDVSKSPYSQGNLSWTKDAQNITIVTKVKPKRKYKKRAPKVAKK